jgi:hypothetical protein
MTSGNISFPFESIYEDSASKFLTAACSMVAIVVNGPLIFFVIWQEKNGPDLQQTLLNKLVVSVCWVCGLYFSSCHVCMYI